MTLGLLLATPCGAHADDGLAARAQDGLAARLDRWLGAVVSPQSLARAHADLEGLSQCTECHAGLRETPDARCLDCHEAVAERRVGRVGWHGQLEGRCVGCHGEHRGVEADLLGLDREGFNHELARFALRGAHAELDCEACHLRAGQAGREGFHAQGIAFERCTDCHEDAHGEDFLAGRDCGVCHSDRSFRADALVAEGFDHARDTEYALVGAHGNVACTGCHTPETRAAQKAAARAPGHLAAHACATCHEDPHAGALGAHCESCHTPAGWKAEAARAADGKGARFDHARDTRFPLDALHERLACDGCHAGLDFAAAGRECADCHGDAAALLAGQLGEASVAPDPHAEAAACRDCHAAGVAAPSLLDYERACLACHPPSYASLLVSRKRIVDELVVRVESALRTRALARERGETVGTAAADAALAAQVARVARSGLHHGTLSESVLLLALDALESDR